MDSSFSKAERNKVDSIGTSSIDGGGSVNDTGVIAGANEMVCGVCGSEGAQFNWKTVKIEKIILKNRGRR